MAITASPTSIAFASTARGASSAATTVTLTPDSTGDSIHGVSLGGPDKANFTFSETFDVPVGQQAKSASTIVVGGATATFTVTFSPTATSAGGTAGAKTAIVRVHHNGPGNAFTTEIPVSGTAT